MIDNLLAKVFGTKTEREIKAIRPTVAAINDLEAGLQKLSDTDLAAQTITFKERLDQGAKLDDLLIEAFALVREAGRRTLNMRHFDVQLIGGYVLHTGRIAEMKTGEGKTLVATLPVYLNALAGKGVHVITVNDYLAHRDADWMGRIYKFLGLSVGIIVHDLDDHERQNSYNSDITYGTNNEFGFDYLRDNMKFRKENCVQRSHNYCIVDEVDSILIDEARTPLIISGPSEESTDKYYKVNKIIPYLKRGEVIDGKEPGIKYTTGDYTVDEKHRGVALTEEGVLRCEKLLSVPNLYDPQYVELNHHVQQALKAHVVFQRDKDYVVKEGQVIIVDEFTGRLMPGRRWSDGLHQAVEAKENVRIERENQTLATIIFQNYFRMYKKLSGMTGTAETEAAEFQKTYNLDVTVIPTNRQMFRIENPDVVFRTEEEKFRNAAKEIKEFQQRGQPVLVGTISVEKSEKLSNILKKNGVPHEVLNAKNHSREALIVAQAGRKGAVTVSTNMAGRGTDILLGGNPEYTAKEALRKQGKNPDQLQISAVGTPEFNEWRETFEKYKSQWSQDHDEVVALGGLHIVGTERHESRRIDNQLRGRAGRQGDPGESRFFLSLEDDLMRIFAKQWISTLLERLGMEEGVPIESKMLSNRIEGAQKAVESQNFESRKHLLEYDDVMNKQREAVYGLRRQLLEGVDQKELILEDYVGGILSGILDEFAGEKVRPDQWNVKGLEGKLIDHFGLTYASLNIGATGIKLHELSRHELGETIFEKLKEQYEAKEKILSSATMRYHERMVMLSVIDGLWKDHLLSMDHLKEGIGLRGYAQRDPLVEYKRESYDMFEAMMLKFQEDTVRFLFRMQILGPDGEPMDAAPRINRTVPAAPPVASAAHPLTLDAEPREISIHTRQPSTTIDALEKEFRRKKERELEAASRAGAGETSQPTQRRMGEKVGRNDPCPCGSGKKYKKCHGAGK